MLMMKTMKIKESTKETIGKTYLFFMILAFSIMSFTMCSNNGFELIVIIVCQLLMLLFMLYYIRVIMLNTDKDKLQKQIDELKKEIEDIKNGK